MSDTNFLSLSLFLPHIFSAEVLLDLAPVVVLFFSF